MYKMINIVMYKKVRVVVSFLFGILINFFVIWMWEVKIISKKKFWDCSWYYDEFVKCYVSG